MSGTADLGDVLYDALDDACCGPWCNDRRGACAKIRRTAVEQLLPVVSELLADLEDRVVQLTEALANARRFAAHVEAQNARALALHLPFDADASDTFCVACLPALYPCATRRALSGCEPSPVVEREGQQ